MLQLLHPFCKCIGGIIFQNRTGGLENGGTMIVLFIYIMNSNTALFFSCCYYSLVHKISIHTLAAKFW